MGGYMARMGETKNSHRILVEKFLENVHMRRTWEDKIKIYCSCKNATN
jgi:hypothetical protein